MTYHVLTLRKPSELLLQGQAGFRGPGNLICQRRGDVVAFEGWKRQSVRVENVYPVGAEEVVSLFRLYGIRLEDKETPLPEFGAEVEELD